MNSQLRSIFDVVVDRSPEELIGSVLIALVLALALAGLFLLLRRRVSDVSTLIISLALGSNLVAMIVAGAFVRYRLTDGRVFNSGMGTEAWAHHMPVPRGMRGMAMAGRIFAAADHDADGYLSPDEAASAAAEFVEKADEGGTGRIDEDVLREAIRAHLGPPRPPTEGGPPTPARSTGQATAATTDETRDRSRE